MKRKNKWRLVAFLPFSAGQLATQIPKEEETNGEEERGEEKGQGGTQIEKENKHCLMIVTE